MAGKTFVFSVVGTVGDALPFIAIGRELVLRGNTCFMLGNEPFEEQATEAGMQFHAICPKQHNNNVSPKYNLSNFVFPTYQPSMEFFRSHEFDRKNTMVVNLGRISGSNSICELYGLHTCQILLAPWRLESKQDLPWPGGRISDGPLGKLYRKYVLPSLYREPEAPFVLDTVNQFRRDWGLSDIENLRLLENRLTKRMALFPEWYSGRPKDWPKNLAMTNFPLPSSPATLGDKFCQFIQSQDKRPIVFTPGTGIPDVEEFFERARQCCEMIGRPGIFLSPYASSQPGAYGPLVSQSDYIDLQLVLQHCALLVHHGGIGTTARALEAGIPQIVIPLAYDQPDNGNRIARLGVGNWLDAHEANPLNLSEMITQLLSCKETTQRIANIRDKVHSRNGVEECATYLELF